MFTLQRWCDDYLLFLSPKENGVPNWELAAEIDKVLDSIDAKLNIVMTIDAWALDLTILGHYACSGDNQVWVGLTPQRR